jgi:MoxR-like ATPase
VLQDDPETGKRHFMFSKGPIFANILLADEINRTPPKTQAALLEAMQENMVSAGGEDYHLDLPFFVLATQNPLEQEGTYPLPEAQLDRFMFKIHVDYPSKDEEVSIMKSITGSVPSEMTHVLNSQEIIDLQDLVRRVPVADHIYNYAATLIRATRPDDDDAPDFIRDWISWGAGPRACLNVITGSKARAVFNGRFSVAIEDVQALAMPVMRHRMGLNFAAQSEGITPDEVVKKLIEAIPADEKLYDAAKATA